MTLLSTSQAGLPTPVSTTAAYARGRSRQRWLIILACFVCAVLVTHSSSRSYAKSLWDYNSDLGAWGDREEVAESPGWMPSVEEDANRILPPAVPPPSRFEENQPEDADLPELTPRPPPGDEHRPPMNQPLAGNRPATHRKPAKEIDLDTVRIVNPSSPQHIHAFPSALEDPWPQKPFIAKDYLTPDLESARPLLPKWPRDEEVLTHPLETLKQVSHSKMFVPPDYSRPPRPGKRKALPKIQFDFAGAPPETEEHRKEREKRKEWVRTAMKHAWNGYKKHAWGHDELRPVTNKGFDGFNGWGASIIDALDTLLLMDMPEEYNYGRTHVQALDFTLLSGGASAYGRADGMTIPTFETTIRYLGGLLGAHDISGDSLMLTKARELADWIIGCFNTKSGLPIGRYRLGDNPRESGMMTGRLILSEAGSMSLEYTRLWQLTGKDIYYDIQRATDSLDTGFDGSTSRLGRLLPPTLTPDAPTVLRGSYSFSAMCDSYYEYLIKEHLLLGGAVDQYARMYSEAIDSAYTHIIRNVTVVPGEDLLTIGEAAVALFRPTLDHLTCFAGAMMGIGAKLLGRPQDLQTAEKFTYTCFWAYNSTATGIGPESLVFYKEQDVDRYKILYDKKGEQFAQPRGDPIGTRSGWNQGYGGRPETIESVFYMYRITGDTIWQDRAWQMFVNWVNHTITATGFAGIHHVGAKTAVQKDTQESFVFAETLKYYYLAFCEPDFLSLDDWVFNTEAHPLRLRPDDPLAVPVSTWNASDPDVDRQYLEPLHASSHGRGTSVQRQWRAQHSPKPSLAPKPSLEPTRPTVRFRQRG